MRDGGDCEIVEQSRGRGKLSRRAHDRWAHPLRGLSFKRPRTQHQSEPSPSGLSFDNIRISRNGEKQKLTTPRTPCGGVRFAALAPAHNQFFRNSIERSFAMRKAI